MTVVVATPHGEVSGSSVVQVNWYKHAFPPLSGGWGHHTVKGEAVVVDLGEGQLLFALLSYYSGNPGYTWGVAFDLFGRGYDDKLAAVRAANGRGPVALPLNLYPMFVRFRDLDDRKTVERVDPSDLAVSFGPGYRLVRVTLEITNDSVTTGIEKRLKWLANRQVALDGQRYRNYKTGGFADSIGVLDFQRDGL